MVNPVRGAGPDADPDLLQPVWYAMKAIVWIVGVAAVGFGVYWFVIRPRRIAAAKEQGLASIKAVVGGLRGFMPAQPLAVN
jgi:hypothetical protein